MCTSRFLTTFIGELTVSIFRSDNLVVSQALLKSVFHLLWKSKVITRYCQRSLFSTRRIPSASSSRVRPSAFFSLHFLTKFLHAFLGALIRHGNKHKHQCVYMAAYFARAGVQLTLKTLVECVSYKCTGRINLHLLSASYPCYSEQGQIVCLCWVLLISCVKKNIAVLLVCCTLYLFHCRFAFEYLN